MIINSRADLARYVDDVLSGGWQFETTIDILTEEITSTIHRMSTPRYGDDWGPFLDALDWGQIIISADDRREGGAV